MEKVISADGTPIAFDRSGEGPPVVVVAGALCGRDAMRPVAVRLARHFSVLWYDRRGRGDSGDTAPYEVEREIEDLGAIIEAAGGSALVYGHSSGAALALLAASAGLPMDGLALYEPPYGRDTEETRRGSREFAENLNAILAGDRPSDAVRFFMTSSRMPPQMPDEIWRAPKMVALAHTIAYDSEVLADISRGGTFPADLAGGVKVPALVLTGGTSPAWMSEIGGQVAEALPEGRHSVVEGQGHLVAPEVLVPVLVQFFARQGRGRSA